MTAIFFIVWFVWGLCVVMILSSSDKSKNNISNTETCKVNEDDFISCLEKYKQDKEIDRKQNALTKAEDDVNENIRLDTSNYLRYAFTYATAALGVFLTLILIFVKGEDRKGIDYKLIVPQIMGSSIVLALSIIFILLYFLVSKKANIEQNKLDVKRLCEDEYVDYGKNIWIRFYNVIEITIFTLIVSATILMMFVFEKII